MTFIDMLKTAMVERLGLPDDHLYLYTAIPIDKAFKGVKNKENADKIFQNIIPSPLDETSTKHIEVYFDSNKFTYLSFKDKLIIEIDRLNS